MNHTICHGDLGNLETVLTATLVLNELHYSKQLANLTAMIIDSIEKYGPLTGVPLGVETPGLMSGISGIGYQLLRLAQPQSVLAVLLVAPPVE